MKKSTLRLSLILAFIQCLGVLVLNDAALATNYKKVTGGTATASMGNSQAPLAFDSNTTTKWEVYFSERIYYPSTPSEITVSLLYQLPSARKVTMYKITSGLMQSWTLMGSNDGTNWTTLHIGYSYQIGQNITFTNTNSYSRYQIVIVPYNSDCEILSEAPPVLECDYQASVNELELYMDGCNPQGTLAGQYECTGNMETQGTIESGTTSVFFSSQSISLKPGFWAKAGSVLIARIDSDIDNDNLPDAWEILYFGNTTQYNDANLDPDGDSISLYWEYMLGLSPTTYDRDTDDDGVPDWYEIQQYQNLSTVGTNGECNCD